MLRSILNSFARAYGKGLGYSAARRTSWLAIPLLIIVAVLGFAELAAGGGELRHLVTPIAPYLPW